MRIVHINSSTGGGAGICAQRIINATHRLGVESVLLIKDAGGNTDGVVVPRVWAYNGRGNVVVRGVKKLYRHLTDFSYRRLNRMMDKCHRKGDPVVSLPVSACCKDIWNLQEVKSADVVHLHWVSGLIDYESFFKHAVKPIVWTLHDENPGLGVFHYTNTAEDLLVRYKKIDDVSRKIKKRALSGVKNLHLVAISTKMKEFIKANEILSGYPCTMINNGIEAELFEIRSKVDCRTQLDIGMDRLVFMYSSGRIEDPRKGLAVILGALEALDNDKITLICLGAYDKLPETSVDVRCFGRIKGIEKLSLYYSAADCFLLASSAEAFAQTPLESMACGTPVVAFPCSGATDLINEHNGVLCGGFDVESLVQGIREFLNHEYDSMAIRRDVLERYNYDLIASQYVALYKRVLKR